MEIYDSACTEIYKKTVLTQLKIKQKIAKQEKTVAKWKSDLELGKLPSDLSFKFEGYKQFPQTVSKDTIAEAQLRETDLLKTTQIAIVQSRIKVLEDSITALQAQLITDNNRMEFWATILQAQLPAEWINEQICTYAMNLIAKLTSVSQYDDHKRAMQIAANAANADSTTTTAAAAQMDDQPAPDPMAQMQTRLEQLADQLNKLTMKPQQTRQRNTRDQRPRAHSRQRTDDKQRQAKRPQKQARRSPPSPHKRAAGSKNQSGRGTTSTVNQFHAAAPERRNRSASRRRSKSTDSTKSYRSTRTSPSRTRKPDHKRGRTRSNDSRGYAAHGGERHPTPRSDRGRERR